eukprot:CAMPEP_0179480096 /NCGR_PEP_ID=MMETSP0799-20121207/58154_1 /TAXON_ID=46947 /ORGANISM="Geminigera cryophila, Strain CCMP2564" /LENGTH=328 /DNA_ID=CAMNT_0021292021 /DNA_START=202 /DNA_END=1184 /DNA_ORIENTATION=+
MTGKVETRLVSFAELEARAESIQVLASLPPTLLHQLHPRMLLHALKPCTEVPENLRENVALFVVSGSLDTFQPEAQNAYMSLTAGNFCCASDLKDSNLGAKAGKTGLVILTLPQKIWLQALYERELDNNERIQKITASVIPLSATNWLPTNMRLTRYSSGSIIVRQGDPVEQLMWVERGSCAVLVCFRADSHVSKETLPGCHLAGPLVRSVSSLNAGDSLGGLVHVVPEAFSLLIDSRALKTSISSHLSIKDVQWQKQNWQWNVCVPTGGEVYVLSVPFMSSKRAPASVAAAFGARAKLEASWWIKQLKWATVADALDATLLIPNVAG